MRLFLIGVTIMVSAIGVFAQDTLNSISEVRGISQCVLKSNGDSSIVTDREEYSYYDGLLREYKITVDGKTVNNTACAYDFINNNFYTHAYTNVDMYLGKDKPSEVISTKMDGTVVKRTKYCYNSKGLCSKVTVSDANSCVSITNNIYDANNNLVEVELCNPNNSVIHRTKYFYENNSLAKYVVYTASGAVIKKVFYSGYVTDRKGNWVERTATTTYQTDAKGNTQAPSAIKYMRNISYAN